MKFRSATTYLWYFQTSFAFGLPPKRRPPNQTLPPPSTIWTTSQAIEMMPMVWQRLNVSSRRNASPHVKFNGL